MPADPSLGERFVPTSMHQEIEDAVAELEGTKPAPAPAHDVSVDTMALSDQVMGALSDQADVMSQEFGLQRDLLSAKTAQLAGFEEQIQNHADATSMALKGLSDRLMRERADLDAAVERQTDLAGVPAPIRNLFVLLGQEDYSMRKARMETESAASDLRTTQQSITTTRELSNQQLSRLKALSKAQTDQLDTAMDMSSRRLEHSADRTRLLLQGADFTMRSAAEERAQEKHAHAMYTKQIQMLPTAQLAIEQQRLMEGGNPQALGTSGLPLTLPVVNEEIMRREKLSLNLQQLRLSNRMAELNLEEQALGNLKRAQTHSQEEALRFMTTDDIRAVAENENVFEYVDEEGAEKAVVFDAEILRAELDARTQTEEAIYEREADAMLAATRLSSMAATMSARDVAFDRYVAATGGGDPSGQGSDALATEMRSFNETVRQMLISGRRITPEIVNKLDEERKRLSAAQEEYIKTNTASEEARAYWLSFLRSGSATPEVAREFNMANVGMPGRLPEGHIFSRALRTADAAVIGAVAQNRKMSFDPELLADPSRSEDLIASILGGQEKTIKELELGNLHSQALREQLKGVQFKEMVRFALGSDLSRAQGDDHFFNAYDALGINMQALAKTTRDENGMVTSQVFDPGHMLLMLSRQQHPLTGERMDTYFMNQITTPDFRERFVQAFANNVSGDPHATAVATEGFGGTSPSHMSSGVNAQVRLLVSKYGDRQGAEMIETERRLQKQWELLLTTGPQAPSIIFNPSAYWDAFFNPHPHDIDVSEAVWSELMNALNGLGNRAVQFWDGINTHIDTMVQRQRDRRNPPVELPPPPPPPDGTQGIAARRPGGAQ